MKKLLFVFVLFFGMLGITNAKTFVSIDGIPAFSVDHNAGGLPTSGLYNVDRSVATEDQASTFSWGFHVDWYDDYGSGGFDVGGDGIGAWGDFCALIKAWLRY